MASWGQEAMRHHASAQTNDRKSEPDTLFSYFGGVLNLWNAYHN